MRRICLALVALTWGVLGAAHAAELPATLHWGQRAELGTLVSGVVAEVAARPGQRVARGELLVRLDDRGFRARVDGARAAVTRAKVRYEEAEREHERALELYDRTVLSEHERQLAEIAYQEARAELQAARARLVQAELELERSRLVAPYDAVVLQVRVGPGQVVVSDLQSEPLVVVAGDRLTARGLAPVAELAGLEPGAVVEVEVRGERYPGRVSHIGLEPAADGGAQRVYPVEVSLEVPQGTRLYVGEDATIRWGEDGGA